MTGFDNNMRRRIVGTLASGIAIACATTASAQGAEDAAAQGGAEQQPATAGGEIVVTARRQAESLQNVPLSVQAFGGEQLESAGIRDVQEITNRVPGAKLNTSNATDPEIFIRGIGNDIQGAGADGSIGFFLDGVYLSRATGTLIDLFDLERVEVLKGPQSLRFGKNVVGGLIHYIHKKPSFTTEARIEGSVGNYNQMDAGVSVRGPLTDTIAAGFTFTSRNRDGFATNTLGGDEEDISVQSARAALRIAPSDDFDLTLAADYTRRRDGARWVDVHIPGTSEAVTFNRFFAPPIPGLPADFSLPARNAPFKNADPRKGPRNFSGYQDIDLWGLSANLDLNLSDSLTLNSITAYRDTQIDVREDGCGVFWDFPIDTNGIPIIDSAMADVEAQQSVFPYLDNVPDCWFDNAKTDNSEAFSQELRLSYDAGGSFRASAGAYYLDEKIDRLERVAFYFPDFDGITEIAFALAFGGTPGTPAGGISNAATATSSRNIGLFAEGSIDFTDSLTLNAGLRYAHDRKKFTARRFGDSFDAPLPPDGFVANDTQSWDAWLPSATLSFQPNNEVNIFARIERGYKAGGFTGEGAGNPLDAIVSFAPEFALTHELGGKFLLFDRRLRLNVTAYLTKYDDLQTQQFLQLDPQRPPDNFVVNAANGAEAYGVEVDIFARPTDFLNLFGNYAYTRCEFTGELIISEGVDIDGNTCRRTPKHAFTLGGELTADVSDTLTARLGGDIQYTSSYFFDNENLALTKNPAEHTINVRASIENEEVGWEFSVWAKNLTNELNFADKLELFGTVYANYQPPRTYGVTASWKF
jgi:iron complex outermembrane receptor protein